MKYFYLTTISLYLLISTSVWANPINRHTAKKYAETAYSSTVIGGWNAARREWARAVVNAEMGGVTDSDRATLYYEYGRSAGVTCYFDIAQEYLEKSYQLDLEIGGPVFLSLVELFRLNLDQYKYPEAVKYFQKALLELEKINAPQESPAEFSKLLEEYSLALNEVGNVEEAKKAQERALEVKESAQVSTTERTPYGQYCQ